MAASEGRWFDPRTESKVKIPSENGKSAIFQNSRGDPVLLVHADRYCRKGRRGCADCFIAEKQKVADYIVCKPRMVDVIVELKGTDLMAAVGQIEATIPPWEIHEKCSGRIGALIVSGKGGSHPTALAKFLVKQDQFKSRGIILRHTTNPNAEFEFSLFA